MDRVSTRKDVLVAEDDDEDFLIFTLALEDVSIGVTVERAGNGEELMKILLQRVPEILFLDIQMPCKDGRACLKEIRSNERYDRMPIIILTSFSDPGTKVYCFQKGSNVFMEKPALIGELSKFLDKVFVNDWQKNWSPGTLG